MDTGYVLLIVSGAMGVIALILAVMYLWITKKKTWQQRVQEQNDRQTDQETQTKGVFLWLRVKRLAHQYSVDHTQRM